MSKTKEELDALKEEVETLNEKLQELTEEEIAQVSGGVERPGSLTIAIQSLELRGVDPDILAGQTLGLRPL